MVKLTAAELDRALGVLEAPTPGTFFPRPFEFDCLRASWAKVRPELERVDLLSYTPHDAATLVAPKQRYTVRPVQALDPVDEIFYTALAIRLGGAIEAARVPRQVVYSHRYSAVATSSLFESKPTWNDFDDTAIAASPDTKFIAAADIVDFYPRIYQHRLENALTDMTGLGEEVAVLAKMLNFWSGKSSYGIPTGPVASALFAEAVLHEVDDFLVSRRVRFVRWVDDYRIFGASESECLRALFLLGERLQQTQGLSLNMAKTRVSTAYAFRRTSPAADIRDAVIRKVFGGNPYAEVDYDALTEEQKKLIGEVDAKALLKRALVTNEVADFRAVAFVLTVLTAFRRPELADIVLSNLDRLAPVSEAVARFLNVFDKVDSPERAKLGGALVEFWSTAPLVPSYQWMWLLQPFTRAIEWNHLDEIRRIAAEHENPFVRRQAVLAIGASGRRPAILDVRPKLSGAPDWEKRAALFACRALPPDERDPIARNIKAANTWAVHSCLMRAVAEYITP